MDSGSYRAQSEYFSQRLEALLAEVCVTHDARAACLADSDGLLIAGAGPAELLEPLAIASLEPSARTLPDWAPADLRHSWYHCERLGGAEPSISVVSSGGRPLARAAIESVKQLMTEHLATVTT